MQRANIYDNSIQHFIFPLLGLIHTRHFDAQYIVLRYCDKKDIVIKSRALRSVIIVLL